ncbi:MAG: HD domain-containing protein [Ignavibacteriae bacterium]|nr:HD domain-containing protein [Ignavibacteriota bacterium]
MFVQTKDGMNMASENDIVSKASKYVTKLLTMKLPGWAVYHNLDHTREVVDACTEIGEGSKLNRDELEVVTLASWFHDTGYTQTSDGHEEKSVEIANAFLQENGYPQEKVAQIASCIMATRMPQSPSNAVESVICDADMAHLGKKKLFEKTQLMRMETELRLGKMFTDMEWLNKTIELVSRSSYHTRYAQSEFGGRRTKNLIAMQNALRDLKASVDGEGALAKLKKENLAAKLAKQNLPERGIETMFRVVPKNHLDLSALADQKANIMISTNAIIMSVVAGLLLSKLDTHPHLVLPTAILMLVCMAAMIFAIRATRPNVTTGTFTREDIEQKRANLLFFGNFHNSTLEDFTWGMQQMMNDREYLYGSMIKDLYFLGKVLGVKYKYLRICYNIFMYGLVVALIAFVIAFITAPPPVG